MKLDTARVLVTGGSSGIGLATADLLVKKGARVAICSRDASRVERAAKSIGAVPIAGDVSVEADCARIVETAIRDLDGYDVLINNAGFGTFSELVDLSVTEMQRILGTNLLGAMMMARESARHFVSKRRGNIVNIGSTAAERGFAGGTAYVASKFALSGMTECWRAELRKHDIRVMQVNPSEVQTEFIRKRNADSPVNPTKLLPEDIAHAIVSILEMDDRGFTTTTTVWATNPQ